MSTANFQEFTTSPDRFRCESIAYWQYSLEASAVPSLHRLRSRCNCGILSLCIKKELNFIEYRGSKKYRNYSCLYMTVVAVASPLSLVEASSLGKAMSSLLLALNFNSAFCCCARGVLLVEDFHPLFESRVVVFAFVGISIEGICS